MSHVHFLLTSVITNYALTWCEIFLKDADVADHIDIDIDIDMKLTLAVAVVADTFITHNHTNPSSPPYRSMKLTPLCLSIIEYEDLARLKILRTSSSRLPWIFLFFTQQLSYFSFSSLRLIPSHSSLPPSCSLPLAPSLLLPPSLPLATSLPLSLPPSCYLHPSLPLATSLSPSLPLSLISR